MAILGALVGRAREKSEKKAERIAMLKYVGESLLDNDYRLLQSLENNLKQDIHRNGFVQGGKSIQQYREVKRTVRVIEKRLAKLYDSDYKKFEKLKESVEMLQSIVVRKRILSSSRAEDTVDGMNKEMQRHQKIIEDILNIEIKD